MSTTAPMLPLKDAVAATMPSRRALNARTTPRFASSVAWSLPAAWMFAAPVKAMVTVGGVQLALAETEASQFASHFASTLQPPSSLPPLHWRGS